MRYKIIPAKYELSEQLGKELVNCSEPMYHVEIYRDKERTAYLTRKTYDEAKKAAEEYVRLLNEIHND